MRAWVLEWGGMKAVYRAETLGRARYAAAMSISEFFGVTVGQALVEMKCRRTPQDDGLGPGHVPEHVRAG